MSILLRICIILKIVNRFVKNRIRKKNQESINPLLKDQDILLSKKRDNRLLPKPESTVDVENILAIKNDEIFVNKKNSENIPEYWVKKNYNKGDLIYFKDALGNINKYRCEINHNPIFYDKFSKGEFTDYYFNKDKKIYIWSLLESNHVEKSKEYNLVKKSKIDKFSWVKDYYNEGDYVLINSNGEKLFRCEKNHGPDFYDNFGKGEFIDYYEKDGKKIFFWCLVEDRSYKSEATNILKENEIIDTHILNTGEYKNYCLFLSLNSSYIIGYRVFIQSFIKHNLWFDGDIVIMDLDLSDRERDYVSSFYRNIIFVKPSYENYIKINKSKLFNASFINNYYKLDIFQYTKYEKIVSMDCDMLITGDLSELFFENYKFGAVPVATHRSYEEPPFNGGLIVLDSKVNCIENYKTVLSNLSKPYRFAEQDLLNELYGKVYYKIPKIYNVEKRILDSKHIEDVEIIEKTKVMHFVGSKPWDIVKNVKEMGYEKFESAWHEHNKPKVIVLGNSPVVLDYKLGKLIDSFDFVVRINNFKIDGFEDFVGTKLSYIICTFATKITDYYKKIDNDKIFMFAAEKKYDYEFLKKRVTDLNIDKINILDDYYLGDLNEKIGITLPFRATSGLIGIEFALNTFKNSDIYIHGIEPNKISKNFKSHYFYDGDGKNQKWIDSIDKYHKTDFESIYIDNLINNGILKKLF
jgi:hypothetical protein